jgi:hypothetical protein
VVKVKLLLFFDAHGMILQHWDSTSVDSESRLLNKRPEKTFCVHPLGRKDRISSMICFFFLQDNARPKIAAVALAALIEIGGSALNHPPYSPDVLISLGVPQLMLPEAPQPYTLLYYPRIGYSNFLRQFRAATPPKQRKLEL